MSLESDLARVRGLGSAKHGTHTFWHQTNYRNRAYSLVVMVRHRVPDFALWMLLTPKPLRGSKCRTSLPY